MTHATMLLVVDVAGKAVTKWKVENGWGKDVGEKGFFVMSSDWFRDYVCQVVVDKNTSATSKKRRLPKSP